MVRRASPAGAAARNGAQIKNDAISAPPGPNGCDRRRLRNVPPAEPRGGRAVGRTPLPANGTAVATSAARPPIGKARFSPGRGGAGPPFSPGRAGGRALIRCDSLARCPRRSSSAKCSQSAPIIYLWGLSVSSWLTRRVRGVARGAFSPSRAGGVAADRALGAGERRRERGPRTDHPDPVVASGLTGSEGTNRRQALNIPEAPGAFREGPDVYGEARLPAGRGVPSL